MKFMVTPSIGSTDVLCGQAGGQITKLRDVFRNFVEAPKTVCKQ